MSVDAKIRALAKQGKTEQEIATVVGVTMGDVASVLALSVTGDDTGGELVNVKLSSLSIAHDTPGLADGVTVYEPAVDDCLLNCWVELATPWDGTTPQFDIGTFVTLDYGLFGEYWGPVSLAGQADTDLDGLLVGNSLPSLATFDAANETGIIWQSPAVPSVPQPQKLLAGLTNLSGQRIVPVRFTAAHPLKVVVSQTGRKGGAAPGSTRGAATVFMLVGTPD